MSYKSYCLSIYFFGAQEPQDAANAVFGDALGPVQDDPFEVARLCRQSHLLGLSSSNASQLRMRFLRAFLSQRLTKDL